MVKRKLLKYIIACTIVTGVLASSIVPSLVAHAKGVSGGSGQVLMAKNTQNQTITPTPSGVANFGRGSATISITGNTAKQSLLGKKFNVYKIFNAENSVGLESINYTLNPEYAPALKNVVGKKLSKAPASITEYEILDYIQSLNKNKVEGANAKQALEGRYSDFRYFVEELRNEIVKLGVKADVVSATAVKANNSIDLVGLDFGYYVVDEVTNVVGTHSAGSLCMVNTANPTASIQVKSDFPSVIKKIKEDDHKDVIGNDGWNDIGDYEIGQTIPYKFESNVPNMNGYDTYYYAWHDKMDEALTFNKASVGVKVTDATGKAYTLKASEFHVVENPGKGETFKVEIIDLKAIVDREFNKKNKLNENVYGQQVELVFDASLNDKAAKDTGRPGFENDVKLEFSNNADGDGKGDKGETPWDTVVCFTYRLNGLKLNDHNVKLKSAKFRLYSDKDCKNEVYVKASDKGYIVMNRDSVGSGIPSNAVEMVSDAEGVFTVIGLDQGTYWVKETQAPDGYRPLLDPIEINIVPTFTADRNSYVKGDGATEKTLKSLEASAKTKEFLGGVFNKKDLSLTTDVKEGSLNLTVVNKVGSKLPVTGSAATITLIGVGSVLMGSSLAYSRKKKGLKAE